MDRERVAGCMFHANMCARYALSVANVLHRRNMRMTYELNAPKPPLMGRNASSLKLGL